MDPLNNIDSLNNTVENTVSTAEFAAPILIVLFIALYIFVLWKKKQNEKTSQYKLTFLQVKLPPDNEIEVKAAEHMFSNLMGFQKSFLQSIFTEPFRISFEIVSKSDGIAFYVIAPNEIATIVEKQINGAYPTAEIDIINPHEIWDRGSYTQVVELKLRGPSYYPLKIYEDLKNDSLSSITSAMSKLGNDEVVAVQYVVQPAGDNWRLAGRRFCSSIREKASNPEKKINIDTSFLEGIEKKTALPGFYTKIRIVSVAKDKFTAQSNVQNMLSAFEQFTNMNYNKLVKKTMISAKTLIKNFIYRKVRVKDIYVPIAGIQLYSDTSVLNIEELATVFHFPNKNIETPNIIWLTARKSSAPTNIPTTGLYLGKSNFRGVEKQIFMSQEDRARHFYIIGQTGTGKSQFLMSLALQDIQSGEGVAIIDPHGTDVEELLKKIPASRKDDIILFDASDTERPMGINMLEARSEEEKHLIINSFIALLYKLYDPNHQGIMGPILERTIRNVMLTAMSDPDSTMIDVMRLLTDQNYSKTFMDRITDPLVKRYWIDEVASVPQGKRGENMQYFTAKFDRFVTDSTMRHILGQKKSAFNFDDVMAQKKVLLVDLSKGKIGEENSNFIGLLLVPRILAAALRRHSLLTKGVAYPDFYLYVDEFQNFATPDFATILSEARKYKLNLTVAHQFISQLDDQIKEAVFGNVGTICSFRVGVEDSEFLENQFAPKFTKTDLINLPIGNCYTRMLVKGQPTPPFSLAVDWNKITSAPKDEELAKAIKEMCRLKYGVPAEEVEEYIKLRAGYEEKKVEEAPLSKIPPLGRIPF